MRAESRAYGVGLDLRLDTTTTVHEPQRWLNA
jgi:hypothetical protein